MDPARFERRTETEWHLEPTGPMRVPAVVFADEALLRDMDDKVGEQLCNVAALPGIVGAAYAMPDAHWGYGFPIGGVAAFDAAQGVVVSAGGVGFDISCGVRTLLTGATAAEIEEVKAGLADALYESIPAGVGSTGEISLSDNEMDAMLAGGARWAVDRGYGLERDLARIEEGGCAEGARPDQVSEKAKKRQRREMGTLGSGNHYLEVQAVEKIYDRRAAAAFGLTKGAAVISIHCGSRGLGHQIGTDYLRDMLAEAARAGIVLPERELACAPIDSDLGRRYLGAMRAGINCALANREIITHLARSVFARVVPKAELELLFDVSHNTCKAERHRIDGADRMVHVHRKGATRAFGPGAPDLPADLADIGQPVLIGGSMGTSSYVLVGKGESQARAFGSTCHGAGRRLSRHAAVKRWKGRQVVDSLADEGILIRSPSSRGVAEEAPGAYKDAAAVVLAAERAGLAARVARLRPMVCIKG